MTRLFNPTPAWHGMVKKSSNNKDYVYKLKYLFINFISTAWSKTCEIHYDMHYLQHIKLTCTIALGVVLCCVALFFTHCVAFLGRKQV
jgi:hypothetical protein